MNEVKKSQCRMYIKHTTKTRIYMSSKIFSNSAGQPTNILNPILRKTFNESYLPVSPRAHSWEAAIAHDFCLRVFFGKQFCFLTSYSSAVYGVMSFNHLIEELTGITTKSLNLQSCNNITFRNVKFFPNFFWLYLCDGMWNLSFIRLCIQ
jgi:hypothetical protein